MSKELNVLEEGKEALVPPFNKKDIEQIAKAACPRGIDLDNLDSYDFVKYDYTVDDIDEAIEKGVIPKFGNYENLTDEQIKGLTKILKKAAKDGIVVFGDATGGDFLFINYLHYSVDSLALCLGCQVSTISDEHTNNGSHLEILLDIENKELNVIHHEI